MVPCSSLPITFPPVLADDLSDEPLIIEAEVEGYLVRRVFVDQGAVVQRAVGPNRLGGTRSSIRKRGSFSKNDDEVYGSKGVIPIQQYPGTYRNERTQGCVVHHSRYDKVPYPKGNRYSGYPNNFCVRMPTIGEEASRTRRESQRGRTGQTKRARRRRNTHPPCFPEQKVTIGTQFSKECRLGE
ncbi:hypothetical protein Tco_0134422 [Tanacetum coccineum]